MGLLWPERSHQASHSHVETLTLQVTLLGAGTFGGGLVVRVQPSRVGVVLLTKSPPRTPYPLLPLRPQGEASATRERARGDAGVRPVVSPLGHLSCQGQGR